MYTQQEKRDYYTELRRKWKETKELAKTNEYGAIYEAVTALGVDTSEESIAFVYHQMKSLNLPGLPFVDMKTFNGWKKTGFTVKKGEHSQVSGLVWTRIGEKKTEAGEIIQEGYSIPTAYKLFHTSQVQPIEGNK